MFKDNSEKSILVLKYFMDSITFFGLKNLQSDKLRNISFCFTNIFLKNILINLSGSWMTLLLKSSYKSLHND
ncbi:hypothetical protein AOE57_02060 [Candidatus Riesia pediculicola]|nr:hypothetical protein AOE57_02060 [Candidatus Riesia pediculicola]